MYNRKNDNELLKYLDKEEINKIASVQKEEAKQDGEIIIKLGDRDRDIYLIKEGAVSIWIKTPSGEEINVATTQAGCMTGELNFVIPVKRSATLKAIGKTIVYRYSYKETLELLKKEPNISAKFFAAINDSLTEKNISTVNSLLARTSGV